MDCSTYNINLKTTKIIKQKSIVRVNKLLTFWIIKRTIFGVRIYILFLVMAYKISLVVEHKFSISIFSSHHYYDKY